MPIPATRTIQVDTVRNYGASQDEVELNDLTCIQTDAMARFLQVGRDSKSRRDEGLEGILREIFPIESYGGQHRMEYVKYELGKPRYSPVECRQLRLTYGRSFRVWL
ncbi:MAG: hypothetical protein HON53_15120, partial [Planctomycetaceae bacterium]|nr:hypothetical protein [Planctomycetaceae bacterium]